MNGRVKKHQGRKRKAHFSGPNGLEVSRGLIKITVIRSSSSVSINNLEKLFCFRTACLLNKKLLDKQILGEACWHAWLNSEFRDETLFWFKANENWWIFGLKRKSARKKNVLVVYGLSHIMIYHMDSTMVQTRSISLLGLRGRKGQWCSSRGQLVYCVLCQNYDLRDGFG